MVPGFDASSVELTIDLSHYDLCLIMRHALLVCLMNNLHLGTIMFTCDRDATWASRLLQKCTYTQLQQRYQSTLIRVHTMTVSLVPSSFIAPTAPDFHHCNLFYSETQPPIFSDCQRAFARLPAGRTPEAWYTLAEHREPFGLPLVIHEGQ